MTVKNAYNAITTSIWSHNCTGWRKKLWHWPLPMKLKLFIWLAANDKIHTWDILLCRGWIGPNMCFLCRCNSETVYHLFWDCPTPKTIWHIILTTLNSNLLWMGTNLQDCMENWSLQRDRATRAISVKNVDTTGFAIIGELLNFGILHNILLNKIKIMGVLK
uniref:Reverse transcriptase zinc-binding domain-containing protein n=1 Tax=Picea sitchensis TaxID=3332 RepID=D5AA94_PICSI|nr:unknown [Picea sitchensis]